MKKHHIISAFLLGFFITSFQAKSQEYLDQLAPVVLSKSVNNNVVTFSKVHQELIEKQSFSFRKEIKKAKKEQSILAFNETHMSTSTTKASYLKTLRKAGNKSENVTSFETYLTKHVNEFSSAQLSLVTLTKLFHAVRANTIEGTLDTLSDALTWL